MLYTPFVKQLNRITQEKLIKSSGEKRCRDVDQDTDPAVRFVGEGLAAVEDGCYESSTEVTSHVGGNSDVGEAPDHDPVAYTDDDGHGGGCYKGVGWIDAGPDYETLYSLVIFPKECRPYLYVQ